MQVFMFRHAERENTGTSDPPLSRRGLMQSQKIADLVKANQLPLPTKIYSSPLTRAKQTLAKLDVEVVISDDLRERTNAESAEQFKKRVQKFLTFLEGQMGIIFFVTHLDWIEEALILMNSKITCDHWPPAQSAEFDLRDDFWHLQKIRGCDV